MPRENAWSGEILLEYLAKIWIEYLVSDYMLHFSLFEEGN